MRSAHWTERILGPREDARWHVSPAVDLSGYAFGWLFIALPAFFLLDAPGYTGMLMLFATGALIDTHRHYTFSYVYLDAAVRRSYPVRFLLLPALALALWTQTPAVARSSAWIAAPEVGAMAAWLWLTLQLAWQDSDDAFQWRTAIPLFLAGIAAATGLTALVGDPIRSGWIWLGQAVAVSFLLHVLVARHEARAGSSRGRAHWLFPAGALAVAGLSAAAAPLHADVPLRTPTNLLLLTFVVWQVYHVIMQKYGILRVYGAKSGQTEKVPGWVDRLLVVGVAPTFLVWAGHSQLDSLVQGMAAGNPEVAGMLEPPLRLLGEHFGPLIALAGAVWMASVGIFLAHEWRVHRLRNAPRLAFALGTTLLYAAVFELGLFKGYLVFASSHGLEYTVFLWAYQRRRYRDEATWKAASSLLRHPVAFYLSFTAVVLGVLFYANYGGRVPLLESLPRYVFEDSVQDWLLWFTLYHGILHFYYDGFLWKLRRPALLAQL